MKLVATKSKTSAHADVGAFSQPLPSGSAEKSKQFFRELLGLTGMEMSVTTYPPNFSSPDFHTHRQNEELYVVVKGKGQMQLDNQIIDITEGSIIRVLPECSRNIKSAADSELVYLCVQAKEGSLQQCNMDDVDLQKRLFGQI